jgi:hypothetical protein
MYDKERVKIDRRQVMAIRQLPAYEAFIEFIISLPTFAKLADLKRAMQASFNA